MRKLVCALAAAFCAAGMACADTADAVRQAAAKTARGARVGVCVRRLSDGREIVNIRGSELFEMASNTKIFTTGAALWAMGVDYQFETQVIADGPVEAGKLAGNLVIKGGGDPNFSGRLYGDTMHVPKIMAEAVVSAGVTEISGDLVMDDRLFDREWRAPGWPAEEALWWYSAPVSALSFNDNCVDVQVKAGARAGAPVEISTNPEFPLLKIDNRAVTIAKGSKGAQINFARGEDGSLTVTGKLNVGDARTESIAVQNPPLFLAAAIQKELEAAGVTLRGTARLVNNEETLTASAQVICTWRSGLLESATVANQRSQNFYAEQILKTLGAHCYKKGTFENGARAVVDFSKAAHLPEGVVKVVDGCGLSMGNKATPQAVAATLETLYKSNLRDAFWATLAVNGDKDTTLKNRLTDKRTSGRLHAKTGTIKSGGISALSGYAVAESGEIYAFSILTNEFQPDALYLVRNMEDAICEALLTK